MGTRPKANAILATPAAAIRLTSEFTPAVGAQPFSRPENIETHLFPTTRTDMDHELVCAVVVAFFPDDGFEERVANLAPQVDALLIVNNTPKGSGPMRLGRLMAQGRHIKLIENEVNLGVGAALNQGLEYACEVGCRWLLTLDQDTQCSADLVRTLVRLSAKCPLKPKVIGSNYFDPRNRRTKVRQGSDNEYLECKTVITSGALVNVDFAMSIGGFRADYFVDQLDHEFCLRVRLHRGHVIISRKQLMDHSVGGQGGARVPFIGILPNHPPLRKYYIARNSMVTIANYWRSEPGWCFRRAVRLLFGCALMAVAESHRLERLHAFAEGVTDAMRRRMGCWRQEVSKSSAAAGRR